KRVGRFGVKPGRSDRVEAHVKRSLAYSKPRGVPPRHPSEVSRTTQKEEVVRASRRDHASMIQQPHDRHSSLPTSLPASHLKHAGPTAVRYAMSVVQKPAAQ